MNIEEITEEQRVELAHRDLELILARKSEAKKLSDGRVRSALAIVEERAIKLLVDFNRAREDLEMMGGTIGDFRAPFNASSALLTFNSDMIPPGACGNVKVMPQCIFKGLRLIVEETCADAFDVTGVYVGVQAQHVLEAKFEIPARLFTPRYALTDLQLNACQISQEININVRNNSKSPARFRAVLFGKSLR